MSHETYSLARAILLAWASDPEVRAEADKSEDRFLVPEFLASTAWDFAEAFAAEAAKRQPPEKDPRGVNDAVSAEVAP